MIRATLMWACGLGLLLSGGCGKSDESARSNGAPGAKQLTIAVIPKGTTHEFWKSVEAGARDAEKELGVKVIWKGPLREDDRTEQINLVEQFTTDRVSGIVLAPLDDQALRRPVQSAMEQNIPVVIFDSALQGEAGKDFVSFVATDSHKGGYLGGQELARLIGNKGKVVLLRYQEGSASTMAREAGFLEAMKEHPEISLLVDNKYAGATADEALKASMEMLDKLKAADGIFAVNESSTAGMLLALDQNKLAGKVKFVGFDTSQPLLTGLGEGKINALVAQNPRRMGYEGVRMVVAHILKTESVPEHVDTGVTLITPENRGSLEVKKLLGE